MLVAALDAPTADEIRAALARVLASPRFRACPRLTSFLRFVVEATLAGRGARLKGYIIGVEAFGRGESFDPQADPIVRVEATRLRRTLDSYYAAEGASDPVLIEVPRGHYIAVFRRRTGGDLRLTWRELLQTLSRLLSMRIAFQVLPAQIARDGLAAGKLAATVPRLLPTAAFAAGRNDDGRQDQQAEGAPAARARRPRAGRDRGDAAHDRGDPRRV